MSDKQEYLVDLHDLYKAVLEAVTEREATLPEPTSAEKAEIIRTVTHQVTGIPLERLGDAVMSKIVGYLIEEAALEIAQGLARAEAYRVREAAKDMEIPEGAFPAPETLQ